MNSKKKDPILEDLENLNELNDLNESDEEKKNPRNLIKIIISLFLIIIIASYIFLSPGTYAYIYGLAGSTLIKNNSLEKQEIKILLNEELINQFQKLYDPLGNEQALCLKGEKEENKYHITDFYEPLIHDQSWRHVSHEPCNEETLIMLHTHPLKRCNPSDTDKNTLRRTQINDPDVLMLVMCGPRRFTIIK